METMMKIQDKHRCLSCILQSIRDIHRSGGFLASACGHNVKIKVWIHYFIGDIAGNNKWLGHYPGNKRQVALSRLPVQLWSIVQSKSNIHLYYIGRDVICKEIKKREWRTGTDPIEVDVPIWYKECTLCKRLASLWKHSWCIMYDAPRVIAYIRKWSHKIYIWLTSMADR